MIIQFENCAIGFYHEFEGRLINKLFDLNLPDTVKAKDLTGKRDHPWIDITTPDIIVLTYTYAINYPNLLNKESPGRVMVYSGYGRPIRVISLEQLPIRFESRKIKESKLAYEDIFPIPENQVTTIDIRHSPNTTLSDYIPYRWSTGRWSTTDGE